MAATIHMSVEIIKPGLLTTLQDGGRVGYAHLGVSRTGAFDQSALRIANALAGNPHDACGLEITLLGPSLRVHRETRIAVTGAPVTFTVHGQEAPTWTPVSLKAGSTIVLGAMPSGCRSYLAVQGGFEVHTVLGSASTDLNAGIGPLDGRALRAGDVLQIAQAGRAALATPQAARTPRLAWRLDPRPWFDASSDHELWLLPGEHFGCLTEASRRRLLEEAFSVQADSNRVGLRLAGPQLAFNAPVEMVSAGSLPGLLQLPPSGQPIVFGVECPVSGGYPRIGQVAAVDLPRLAQLRPGDKVHFTACTFEAAWQALAARERALGALESAILRRLPPTS